MMRTSLFLVIFFTSFQLYADNIVMLSMNADGPVEQGFRDGIIAEMPDTRFYTSGAGGDMSIFRMQLKASRSFDAKIYFTNGQVPTKELLSDKTLPNVVFVSIQYPFQDELFDGVDFAGSAGIKTDIPIRKLVSAMKDVVDFKILGVLKTDNNRNYDYSIKELRQISAELDFKVEELSTDDLFVLNSQLAETTPHAVYIPAHGKVDPNIFDIIKAHNIPTIAENKEDVLKRGALLALVVDGYRAGRIAAKKAVNILKTDTIPQQPINSIEHFLFVVNLMTASRLGVQIPMPYLIIADQIVR